MPALDRLAFDLTPDQLQVADSVRSFARERIAPGAAARDRDQHFPLELVGDMAELGLFAMKVPVEEGGAGADNVAYVLAMEAVAESCASTAVILASSNLTYSILSKHGTSAQKDRFLRGGRLQPASFALTEPGCGSDASALTTSARAEGEVFVLDGAKMWITSGAHAAVHLVFARTGPGEGSAGISAFLVERGTPGLAVGREEDKMGQRASGTVGLHFEDCRVPAGARVGELGGGYRMALASLGGGRVGIAALALGLGEAALEAGMAYAQDRRAFGQRLVDFQATQFALAECRAELDAAWLLTLRAARLLDRHGKAAAESSIAKLYATEAASRVVDRMLQLHGGYGYSKEFPIERYYRDIRVTRIYEGTNEVQRLVIARELLKASEA